MVCDLALSDLFWLTHLATHNEETDSNWQQLQELQQKRLGCCWPTQQQEVAPPFGSRYLLVVSMCQFNKYTNTNNDEEPQHKSQATLNVHSERTSKPRKKKKKHQNEKTKKHKKIMKWNNSKNMNWKHNRVSVKKSNHVLQQCQRLWPGASCQGLRLQSQPYCGINKYFLRHKLIVESETHIHT